ncbi:hypothetical protein [Umezawaea beigongshangensis]|uniref:hypothetical protein n=1 Tax=Umezawaea beigongshangensis TaxID=2780383 RepID=UPI0018F11062|nr:hypothetical protein [Umezawaea beigongshangensis]
MADSLPPGTDGATANEEAPVAGCLLVSRSGPVLAGAAVTGEHRPGGGRACGRGVRPVRTPCPAGALGARRP